MSNSQKVKNHLSTMMNPIKINRLPTNITPFDQTLLSACRQKNHLEQQKKFGWQKTVSGRKCSSGVLVVTEHCGKGAPKNDRF